MDHRAVTLQLLKHPSWAEQSLTSQLLNVKKPLLDYPDHAALITHLQHLFILPVLFYWRTLVCTIVLEVGWLLS